MRAHLVVIHFFLNFYFLFLPLFIAVETWHRRRKILITAFASRYVNKFVRIFDERSKVLTEQLESKVGKGDFSCYDYVCPYALESVCGNKIVLHYFLLYIIEFGLRPNMVMF